MLLSRKRLFVAFLLDPIWINPVSYSLKVRESANLDRGQYWGAAHLYYPLFHSTGEPMAPVRVSSSFPES